MSSSGLPPDVSIVLVTWKALHLRIDALESFLRPASVAVVGASERSTSSGGAVVRNLRRAGFAGRIVPVNPKGGSVDGLDSATSLSALGEPVELVIVAVRPDLI